MSPSDTDQKDEEMIAQLKEQLEDLSKQVEKIGAQVHFADKTKPTPTIETLSKLMTDQQEVTERMLAKHRELTVAIEALCHEENTRRDQP
jgi:uncharacterized coiled-coil protein SlyX